MFSADTLSLYFIMGSQDCKHLPPLDVLKQAIAGGITCFQYREKHSGLTMRETLSLGRALREECRKHQIPFIVNDRVDLALLLDADGVHVGQEDLPVNEVRQLTGEHMWLGVSARTPEEAGQAITSGADYLGVGPMFPTRSKSDAKKPLGPGGLRSLRRHLSTSIPIVAIGGIEAAHIPEIISAGADGIAVISSIASQPHPNEVVRKLANVVLTERVKMNKRNRSWEDL